MTAFNIYSAGFDPQYVEDPMAFKPDRWSRDSASQLDSFLNLGFGVGPRACYGTVQYAHKPWYSILVA